MGDEFKPKMFEQLLRESYAAEIDDLKMVIRQSAEILESVNLPDHPMSDRVAQVTRLLKEAL